MNVDISPANPCAIEWYHGTDATPFKTWQCPPPQRSLIDVQHSGLFFSTNKAFAAAAGKNLCCVHLHPEAKVITPGMEGNQSTEFRKAVLDSHPIARSCQWLVDDKTWLLAWSTGNIMRYAYDANNPKTVAQLAIALSSNAMAIQKMVVQPLTEAQLRDMAMQNLTRSWIEQLISQAKKLGYQAVHGYEIDRWGNNNSLVSQPWLAVTDASAISLPTWL